MTLPEVWFWLVALLLAAYVVFDGFDLGAGILHLFVARTPAERALILRTIGPVWDGNEVWLLAAGGTLYFAFPVLYATAFSGFYLPLMMVLWLLIGRACAIEFRHQIAGAPWQPFWDAAFAVASGLLALFFGVALGNVVRGVPLDENGRFFAPLWTDFSVHGATGILDGYTLLVGATAVCALALHGALWIALKTDGVVLARSRRAAWIAGTVLAILLVAVTAATAWVQPHALARFSDRPAAWLLPAAAGAALAGALHQSRRGRDVPAFLACAAFLVLMLVTVVFSVSPYVLPASTDPARGLTIAQAAAGRHGLEVGLWWWIPGMVLVAGYFAFTYRHFAGRLTDAGDAHGY